MEIEDIKEKTMKKKKRKIWKNKVEKNCDGMRRKGKIYEGEENGRSRKPRFRRIVKIQDREEREIR